MRPGGGYKVGWWQVSRQVINKLVREDLRPGGVTQAWKGSKPYGIWVRGVCSITSVSMLNFWHRTVK